ncbi:MAG: LuxE/PaaK family acyltransferase [Candidatus Helarchaeota archaeon]
MTELLKLVEENLSPKISKNYSDEEFINLMREVIQDTIEKNSYYKELVNEKEFKLDDFNNINDLENIPYIPSPFFKESAKFYKELLKIPVSSPKFRWWNVSSCTTGDPSIVGVSKDDSEILAQLAKKVLFEFIPPRDWDKTFSLIFSPNIKFLNRIAMRYTKIRPVRLYSSNLSEISIKLTKVKFLIKFFFLKAIKAIIVKRNIAGVFGINSKFVIKTIENNLKKTEDEQEYISLGGSVNLVDNFIKKLNELNIKYDLGDKVDISTGGGGWDGRKSTLKYPPINKTEFVNRICETLGTYPSRVVDFYGFTETPAIFGSHWSDKYNDFIMHCPNYARIIVRDLKNLEPISKEGESGFLEVITPFGVSGSVNHAVLIDDLVHLVSKNKCPECGYLGSTFIVLGRVKDKEGLGCSSIVEWL